MRLSGSRLEDVFMFNLVKKRGFINLILSIRSANMDVATDCNTLNWPLNK